MQGSSLTGVPAGGPRALLAAVIRTGESRLSVLMTWQLVSPRASYTRQKLNVFYDLALAVTCHRSAVCYCLRRLVPFRMGWYKGIGDKQQGPWAPSWGIAVRYTAVIVPIHKVVVDNK